MELYTWNLCNFINRYHPNKFNKKEKKSNFFLPCQSPFETILVFEASELQMLVGAHKYWIKLRPSSELRKLLLLTNNLSCKLLRNFKFNIIYKLLYLNYI